ncbi:hypothetical protein [Paenibacillus sp. TH7-28]
MRNQYFRTDHAESRRQVQAGWPRNELASECGAIAVAADTLTASLPAA